ncbi:MAG: hypothetical protein ACXVKA_01590 [Acidimicrobiia bacterium]
MTSSRWLYFALAALLVPVVVGVILLVVVGEKYLPTADFAYTELLTRDVGHHEVLVGLYSRGDWNHPGPALFYLVALPYRITGNESFGINLGALLINGGAIVGMTLIARRRGGTSLMIFTVLGIVVLERALGADFLRNPWNPYVTVLPFGLMILLSWAMSCRELWALPVGVGVASFLAQTHIGYVVLTFPLLVWGVAWLVPLVRRGNPRRRAMGLASAIAVVVVGVMWLPPLLDQLLHSPGNLGRIVRYFLHPDEATHSLADGYRVVAGEFGLPPEWIAGARRPFGFNGEHLFAHSAPPALLLIPFGLAVFVLWRTGTPDARRLVGTLSVALVAGVVAVMRTVGELSAYRLRWTWVLAMLAGVVVLWAAWTWLAASARPSGARWLVALTAVAIGALAVGNTVAAARTGVPEQHDTAVMAALLPPAIDGLPSGRGDVIVRYTSNETRYYAPGIVLGLERAGIAARVEADPAKRYGAHRIHRDGPIRATLTLISGAETLVPRREPPLAFWGNKSRPVLTKDFQENARLQAEAADGTISQKRLVQSLVDIRPDAVAILMQK